MSGAVLWLLGILGFCLIAFARAADNILRELKQANALLFSIKEDVNSCKHHLAEIARNTEKSGRRLSDLEMPDDLKTMLGQDITKKL